MLSKLNKQWGLAILGISLIIVSGRLADAVGPLTTFVPGQTIKASEINANFQALRDSIQSNTIEVGPGFNLGSGPIDPNYTYTSHSNLVTGYTGFQRVMVRNGNVNVLRKITFQVGVNGAKVLFRYRDNPDSRNNHQALLGVVLDDSSPFSGTLGFFPGNPSGPGGDAQMMYNLTGDFGPASNVQLTTSITPTSTEVEGVLGPLTAGTHSATVVANRAFWVQATTGTSCLLKVEEVR